MIQGAEWLHVVNWMKINDASLLSLLHMGVLDWKAPNNRLHQATQAIRHGTAIVLRLLPRIMKLESQVRRVTERRPKSFQHPPFASGGQCWSGMESPYDTDLSYRGQCREASSRGPDDYQHNRRHHPEEQRYLRGEVGDDTRPYRLSFRRYPSPNKLDHGSQGLFWSPTKRPPILPEYYSWIGGDHLEVGHLGHHLGEVSLSLLRLSVVASSTLHAWGGRDGWGDGGGNWGRGGGSQVCNQYSFRRFLYNSAKYWGLFVSFTGSEPFAKSGGFWSWKQCGSLHGGTGGSHWGILGRGRGGPVDGWSSSSREYLSASGSGSYLPGDHSFCREYRPMMHSTKTSCQEGLSSLQRPCRTMSLWTWWMVWQPSLFQSETMCLSQDQRTRLVEWWQSVGGILLW